MGLPLPLFPQLPHITTPSESHFFLLGLQNIAASSKLSPSSPFFFLPPAPMLQCWFWVALWASATIETRADYLHVSWLYICMYMPSFHQTKGWSFHTGAGIMVYNTFHSVHLWYLWPLQTVREADVSQTRLVLPGHYHNYPNHVYNLYSPSCLYSMDTLKSFSCIFVCHEDFVGLFFFIIHQYTSLPYIELSIF